MVEYISVPISTGEQVNNSLSIYPIRLSILPMPSSSRAIQLYYSING